MQEVITILNLDLSSKWHLVKCYGFATEGGSEGARQDSDPKYVSSMLKGYHGNKTGNIYIGESDTDYMFKRFLWDNVNIVYLYMTVYHPG